MCDSILICRLHNDCDFKSTLRRQLDSPSWATGGGPSFPRLLGPQHLIPLLSPPAATEKATLSLLRAFHGHFVRFVSILTAMFDEDVVCTKLRIRGPYLLLIDPHCTERLCTFLLSQIVILQNGMAVHGEHIAMSMKELKWLRFIVCFLRSALQFELYTLGVLGMRTVSTLLLFGGGAAVCGWSAAMAKLFGAVLVMDLPTSSLAVLSKLTVPKLRALEAKAVAATTAFRSLTVSFVRFMVLHHHEAATGAAPTAQQQHLDVLVEALCSVEGTELLPELWSMDRMESAFESEYGLKTKYESSAFLKGCAQSTGGPLQSAHSHSLSPFESAMDSVHSARSCTRKRSQFERRNGGDDEGRFRRFVEEQCFLLLLDRLFPFLLDFEHFVERLSANEFALFHRLLAVLNGILLHFVGAQKWWCLSRLMAVYRDLFSHEALRTEYRQCLQRGRRSRPKQRVALNVKHGIYALVIWICYHHQFIHRLDFNVIVFPPDVHMCCYRTFSDL